MQSGPKRQGTQTGRVPGVSCLPFLVREPYDRIVGCLVNVMCHGVLNADDGQKRSSVLPP